LSTSLPTHQSSTHSTPPPALFFPVSPVAPPSSFTLIAMPVDSPHPQKLFPQVPCV
uniref:Ovule protein n=1 Tax=Rodentolepis nana TaxID=102285 RepID=A0A0R3TJ36_RODNA